MQLVPVKPKALLIASSMPENGQNIESIVAAAAKLCYSKSDALSLMEGLSDEKTAQFLDHLRSWGHESPFEHISFTFAVEGISRACSHQLVRHRLASYSQQSQRYVDLSNTKVGFVIPPEIEQDENLLKNYLNNVQEEFLSYSDAVNQLVQKYIDATPLDVNVTDSMIKSFEKKALEDARYLLPNACETKLVVTMNARSLLNFFSERCCERAQWEIRDLAYQMLEQVSLKAPHIFKNAGAPCVRGKCPEGSKSCGHPKIKKIGVRK